MGRLDAANSTVWKATVLYLVFGVAHAGLMSAYCAYRAHHGNPSDLPCVSLLWTSMDVGGWSLMALSDVVNGHAVLVPPPLVRAVGVAFLGGFIAALSLLFRNPPRSSP